jgi:hypothetical protein
VPRLWQPWQSFHGQREKTGRRGDGSGEMKHAGQEALDELAGLLEDVRKQNSLKEKKHGVFYLKSSAFLHFHEDPEGLFADLRAGLTWERLPVTTRVQRLRFLSRMQAVLKEASR